MKSFSPHSHSQRAFPAGRLALIALLIFAASCLGGCATYRVEASSLRVAASAPERTYVLDVDDLAAVTKERQFKPAVAALRTAMQHRGFLEVEKATEAAVVVRFAYGAAPTGAAPKYNLTRRETTTSLPSNGTGASPGTVTRTTVGLSSRVELNYTVWLNIIARDPKTGRDLWLVDTRSEIGAADVNSILPCMIAAAEPLLDPTMNTSTVSAIGQNSAEVRSLLAAR